MNSSEIRDVVTPAPASVDWLRGEIKDTPVREIVKRVRDLAGTFSDDEAFRRMDQNRVVYRVRWYEPAVPGSEGGLFWGVTTIEPGRVGDEYFMTRGHFHGNRTRAEFYCTAQGNGMLLNMNSERKTWGEAMAPGSLHYVRGENGHRVANTGDKPLIFWACWPTDAGYDYETIMLQGFGARLVSQDGVPVLVRNCE
jgi:glucose-6-phosphate isomerase